MEKQMIIVVKALTELEQEILGNRFEIRRLQETLRWAIKDCDAKTDHKAIKQELLEALRERE